MPRLIGFNLCMDHLGGQINLPITFPFFLLFHSFPPLPSLYKPKILPHSFGSPLSRWVRASSPLYRQPQPKQEAGGMSDTLASVLTRSRGLCTQSSSNQLARLPRTPSSEGCLRSTVVGSEFLVCDTNR